MPTAAAGIAVIGVDSWAGMLQVWRRHARAAGVAELLDLRLGDLAWPPVSERVRLVPCPLNTRRAASYAGPTCRSALHQQRSPRRDFNRAAGRYQ